MKARQVRYLLFGVAAIQLASAADAADIGTAINYQGSLERPAGTPLDGVSCDFRFGLWDAAAGGNQQGASPQTVSGITVSDGVFTASMDFGAGAIDGAARWLEIEVQCPPDVVFTLLVPRVELTPAPHAIRASEGVGPPNALEVDTATGRVGIGTASPSYPLHVTTAGVSQYAAYAEHTAVSGINSGVYGVSDSTAGNGVYGIATALSGIAKGVYGESDSTDGYGVYGFATAGTGSAYGGRFRSNSASGIGVYGEATANTGLNSGVYGVSDGTSGRGVGGEATALTGTTYGGRFESNSTSGIGVFGFTPAVSGDTYGVYGRSDSTDGRGVYGEATAGTGINYGVYGKANSPGGRGIRGEATAGTGISYGVSGQSDSIAGRGVSGFASAASGTTYGVYGQCVSPDGFAGYFFGPSGSRNYFAQSVGIGITNPNVTLHVADGSDASLSSGSGYVVLGDTSGSNLVLDNNEIIARNNGAGASLFINYEGGNVGILRNSASHPLHVGNDSSTGNGAHLTAGGTWTNGSDRNSKENFQPFDAGAILEKVAELPLSAWNYIGETDGVHHIGPMAQDFHAAFGLGHDERYITTIDADGVALAAIQGLYQIVSEKNCEIGELQSQKEALEARVAALETMMRKVLAGQNGSGR